MANLADTNNGSDFTAVTPILLVDTNGYSISDPTVQIVDTQGGTDFSMLKPILIIDQNGQA